MYSAALLVIDVQQGFSKETFGRRNNLDAEINIARLLAFWRSNGNEVIHVHHDSTLENSPLHPNHSGNACKNEALPLAGEMVFRKNVNSAFIGTDLEKYLLTQNIHRLVIVGLTTDHCVSTSVRMASNLGFVVVLVEDATATFDRKDSEGNQFSAEEIHRIHLLSLNDEFCQIASTDEVLSEAIFNDIENNE